MKKIVSVLFFSLFLISSLSAEYIPGKQIVTDEDFVTTTSFVMHPSWDLDNDGINDCEKE